MPLTTPTGFTVAMLVAIELHTPPGAGSVRAVIDPAQTVPAPEMLPATGSKLTVTTTEDAAEPQLLATA